jgi:AraC-like DNA-binding protein
LATRLRSVGHPHGLPARHIIPSIISHGVCRQRTQRFTGDRQHRWHGQRRGPPPTGRGAPTVAEIANALGLSIRTLQRRLALAGRRFGTVLDEVRRACAEELLTDGGWDLREIACRLGYFDRSAFTRAAIRCFGAPRAGCVEPQLLGSLNYVGTVGRTPDPVISRPLWLRKSSDWRAMSSKRRLLSSFRSYRRRGYWRLPAMSSSSPLRLRTCDNWRS